MKKLYSFQKTCLPFLIFAIVIVLNSPIYHQHVDDNHKHDSLIHADYVASHHPNDYSESIHRTDVFQDALPEKSHHTHNHAHYEKNLVRTIRTDSNRVETISVYTFDIFNNLPTCALALNKFSFNSYKPKHHSRNYAKTSSGLSPPLFSV